MINNAARELIARCDVFVETGLHEGETMDIVRGWFPQMPIYELEIDREKVERAVSRLPTTANVRFILGSSEQSLKALIDRGEFDGKRAFAYLDAHWNEYCPTVDEVVQLLRLDRPIIAIDDFDVPGDPEVVNPYKFDYRGEGQTLNEAFFRRWIPADRLKGIWLSGLNAHDRGMGVAFVDSY